MVPVIFLLIMITNLRGSRINWEINLWNACEELSTVAEVGRSTQNVSDSIS